MTDTSAGTPDRTWVDTVRVYFTPVMLSMLVLGFASGLPLYMVFQKLSFWLRDAGLDRATIGFFYWVTLSYTFKFLWAPVVDRVKIPGLHKILGPRRSWIVTAILGTAIALFLISTTNPTGARYLRDDAGNRIAEVNLTEYSLLLEIQNAAILRAQEDEVTLEPPLITHPVESFENEKGVQAVQIPVSEYERLLELISEDEEFQAVKDIRPFSVLIPIILCALLLSYSGATLDVAIDAWRIESAPNTMQANMAAAYSFGYRVAYMTAGLGLAISEWSNWSISFVAMAAAMVISAVLVLFIKEPAAGIAKRDLEGSFALKVASSVIEPFKQFLSRLGWWFLPVLLLVAIYRLSDFTMGVMAAPLYSDLEFARDIVGGVQGGPGLAATMFGLFVGGVSVFRLGLMRSLVIGLVITFITNGAYAWLAATAGPDDIGRLTIAIVGDNLAGGFVTTVFIAYLSSLVDPANAATQYALLSSFYAFFSKFLSGFSGVLADAVGWVWFFVLTAGWTFPAAILLFVLIRYGTDAAKGKVKFAERKLAQEDPLS